MANETIVDSFAEDEHLPVPSASQVPEVTPRAAAVRRVFVRARQAPPLLGLGTVGAIFAPFSMSGPAVRIELHTDDEIKRLADQKHVEVFEDFQFAPFDVPPQEWWKRAPRLGAMMPPPWMSKTQADVMEHINAPQAWPESTGVGVTIAIVDTGVDVSIERFAYKSEHSISPVDDKPWIDPVGHGTMCAAVACAGTEQAKYRGVAPNATLLSARSDFAATDLFLIYRHLLDLKRAGAFPGGLVVSNSYGHYSCAAPDFPDGHPFVDVIRECVREGIVFVFAAGNNHAAGLCKYPAADEGPNTIWAMNGIDEVITVGTVDWTESNRRDGEHANSSRGPGDWSTRKDKPDVVAPTYGEVAWGGSHVPMEWWGTSGACPQVAGMAALLLAKKPDLTPAQILQIVRGSARMLPDSPAACVGAGIIDCGKALKLL